MDGGFHVHLKFRYSHLENKCFLFLAPSVVFGAEAHLLQFEQVHVFWPFSSYLGNQQDVLFGELALTFGGQTNNSTSQNGPQTYLTDQFVRCLHLI